MNITKVKKDSKGLYVRTNGSIYRLELNRHNYATHDNNWGQGFETKMLDLEVV